MTEGKRAARGAPAVQAPTEFEAAALKAALTARPGKSAVKNEHRSRIAVRAAHKFLASVGLDAELRPDEPNAHRWDYGLGLIDRHAKESAWWVEPHPASSTGEVSTMLAKLDWLRAKLASHGFKGLRRLTDEAQRKGIAFRWLATSGDICIRPGSSHARRLALGGLAAPSRHIALP